MPGRKVWSVAFAPQPSYPTAPLQETLIGTITFTVFVSTAFISLLAYAASLKFRCGESRRHSTPVVSAVNAVAAERARVQALTRLLREMPVLVLHHEEGAGAGDLLLVDGCSICLGRFEAGERVRVLPRCNHAYHKDCVDTWLILQAEHSCPLCRTLLLMPPTFEAKNSSN